MEIAIILAVAVAGALVFLGNYLTRIAAQWHHQRVGSQDLAQPQDQPEAHQQARRD